MRLTKPFEPVAVAGRPSSCENPANGQIIRSYAQMLESSFWLRLREPSEETDVRSAMPLFTTSAHAFRPQETIAQQVKAYYWLHDRGGGVRRRTLVLSIMMEKQSVSASSDGLSQAGTVVRGHWSIDSE